MFDESGVVYMCSLVYKFEEEREMERNINKESEIKLIEVFVDKKLNICEKRDVKGLYKKARKGSIKGLNGVDKEYEKKEKKDIVVKNVE
jgi:3'-phosphoadenosine 5'-phosphosulfate synthase